MARKMIPRIESNDDANIEVLLDKILGENNSALDLHTLKALSRGIQRMGGQLGKKKLITLARKLEIASPSILDPVSSSLAFLLTGQILSQLGDYRRALENLKLAYDGYVKLDSKPNVAVTNINIANIQGFLGLDQEALGIYDRTISLLQEIGGDIDINLGAVLANKAAILRDFGNLEEATQLLITARNKFRKAGRKIDVALTDWRLAQIYLTLGSLEKSKSLTMRAEQFLEKHKINRYLAHVRLTKAAAYRYIGNYKEAMLIYRQARAQFELDQDQLEIARVDGEIATLYVKQEQFERATILFTSIQEVFSEYQAARDWAQANMQLAIVSLFFNQHNHAFQLLDQAEKVFHEAGLITDQARIWTNKAIIFHIYLDQLNNALHLFQKSRKYFDEHSFRLDLANTCVCEGNCLVDLGNYDEALELYLQAETVYKRNNMERDLAIIKLNRASAQLKAGFNEVAERAYNELLSGNEVSKNDEIELRCYAGKALILTQNKQWPEALSNYNKAIEVFEHQRSLINREEFRLSIMKDKFELYKQSIFICVYQLRNPVDSLRYLERYKSRVFLDQLDRQRDIIPNTLEQIKWRQGLSPIDYEEIMLCLQIV
jgi:tetratricopeptide (TPR) repeat protein